MGESLSDIKHEPSLIGFDFRVLSLFDFESH